MWQDCHHYCPLCCNMSCIISLTRSLLLPPPSPLPLFFFLSNICWWCCVALPMLLHPHICLKPGCWCLGANYAGLNSPRRQRLTCPSRWALVWQGRGNIASEKKRMGGGGGFGELQGPRWCPGRLASYE